MQEERLLERVRDMERDPERRGAADPGVTVRSVMEHLRKILNTRQGTVLIDDDFGLPDFTNLGSTYGEDTIPDIQKAIRDVILKYEPRLRSVEVSHIPQGDDILAVAFKLVAEIASDEKTIPVVFETVIDPDGKIRVRE